MQRALAGSGSLRFITDIGQLDKNTDHLLFIDCRQCGLDSLLELPSEVFAHLPVVAIVDSQQSIPDSPACVPIQDVVTVDDLGSTAFHWRLKRLLSRYEQPVSLRTPVTPASQLMQCVANQAQDWVIIKDLDHRFVFVCEGFANTVGLSKDQIIGKNDLEIGTDPHDVHGSPDADWTGFWAQDDAAVKGGVPVIEENLNWRTFVSNRRYKRAVRTPLHNNQGTVYGLLVTVSDITDRVLAERNLQARNLMLRRVTKEKKNADQLRQIAEQAVNAKNKFLAAASHDLRQPLHALGLFLTVLENRLSKQSDLEILNKAKLSKDALNALFNSLLDISRLDAGIIEVNESTFPISDLLISIRDEYTQLGHDKGLPVKVDIHHDSVRTDPVLLGRIVRNLIQNAITHTHSGSVSVSCHLSAELININVEDTGPGIPESEQQAIFNEYYQLDNVAGSSAHGLGLGLSIVRRIALLLGIDISLHSIVGDGSRFTISVPRGCNSQIKKTSEPEKTTQLSGIQVFLIDDDAEIREGLGMILGAMGCKCLDAESAPEALAIATERGFEPDVMVVDYQLKNDQRGDAAIQQIREHYQRAIPAIIVTGDTSKVRLLDAKRCGSRLLHKPMEASTLISALHEVLEDSLVTS